jgi:hypothetical protein
MQRPTLNKGKPISKRWAKDRFDFDPSSFYLRMLEEDVKLRVVPIGGTRWNRDFGVSFDAEESEKERADELLMSLSRGETYRESDNEVVTGAIRWIAVHVLQNGVALFEILNGKDEPSTPSDKDAPQKFYLFSFPSKYVFRVPPYYVQFLPAHARDEHGASHVLIPREKVWQIKIPPQLGGAKGWRRLQHDLRNYTDLPRSYGDQMIRKTIPPNYDFSETVRMTRYFLLRRTRTWGWLGRDSSVESQTEFFVVYRTLTFEWAVATLRDHIVAQLNALLVRLGIRAAITLRGVLSPDDILSLRGRMTAGELDFSEALNCIYRTSED